MNLQELDNFIEDEDLSLEEKDAWVQIRSEFVDESAEGNPEGHLVSNKRGIYRGCRQKLLGL